MTWTKKLVFAVLVLAIAIPLIALVFRYVPLHDFIEYWTAAQLLVRHQNPYSLSTMMRMQRAMGWSEPQPLMVMSPPQFLPLLWPLGFLHSYVLARLIWLCLNTTILVIAVRTLWSLYGGRASESWIAIGAAALFFPVWHCLAVAQIGPLLLLGIAGFLCLEERGHLFWAGSALALVTLKPHLFYLFWLALLLWSLQRRELRVVAGAAVTIGCTLGLAVLIDHSAVREYVILARSNYVWEFTSGAGGALRLLLGTKSHALQFAPMLPGIVAFACYWHKKRRNWNWREQVPLLLTLSALTAPYGWPFDEVVLLVPVTMVAAHCWRNPHLRKTAEAWLLATFAGSLFVVLKFGDAPGMTFCAAAVLGYLLLDVVGKKRSQRTRHAEDNAEPALAA
jgi:hypothetical protein